MSIISRLQYDVVRPSAFSTLWNLRLVTTAKKKSADVFKAWIEKQDTYTLLRTLRKRFARNPYTVSNAMNVWECDFPEVLAL